MQALKSGRLFVDTTSMRFTSIITAVLTTGFISLIFASIYQNKAANEDRIPASKAATTRVTTRATATVSRGLPMEVKVDRPRIRARLNWPEEVLLRTKSNNTNENIKFRVKLLSPADPENYGVQLMTDLNRTYTMPPSHRKDISVIYKVNGAFENKPVNLNFKIVPER